jgi:hypothetical protein
VSNKDFYCTFLPTGKRTNLLPVYVHLFVSVLPSLQLLNKLMYLDENVYEIDAFREQASTILCS